MLLTDGRISSHAYDCFVVGSGPAGLTVAMTLAEAGKRVVVFESGDAQSVRSELANSVGYGHYSGDYWNSHWVRTLGGTSSVWAGWCTPMAQADFDSPVVGVRWPIDRADLAPHYNRAARIVDHDAGLLDFETPLVDGFSYRPIPIAGPTRFAEKFRSVLTGRVGVDVALGCSVVGLEANAARSSLTALDYVHHGPDARNRLTIAPAQAVVLAAGGLGNAQLLLQPKADQGVPVGNESGHVGKYLMEHPHFDRAGELVTDAELDRYWPSGNMGRGVHAVVADDALARQEGLYACSLQCSGKTAEHEMARHFSDDTGRPFYHYEITARAEMLPSASNRVFLTGERDRFGFFRLGARCVCDARDFVNVEQTLRVFGASLLRAGRGRVRVNNDRIYKQIAGGGHTMGTTRMGTSASHSVVDRDCRVHGYGNLFVAGSSVFPTGGYANPTLTIVALGLRLAGEIAQRGAAA